MNNTVKDKELLTFSNITNLDMQFAQYIEATDEDTDEKTYKKLNVLLTPDSFVRKYDDGREEDVYPKGISEMREKAPVAMNYLEECGKNSGEGDFLQEWEAWVS